MKYETPDNDASAVCDSQDYRKFIAGDRTMYTQVFWDNRTPQAATEVVSRQENETPAVESTRN